jgi:hypothetical protein
MEFELPKTLIEAVTYFQVAENCSEFVKRIHWSDGNFAIRVLRDNESGAAFIGLPVGERKIYEDAITEAIHGHSIKANRMRSRPQHRP